MVMLLWFYLFPATVWGGDYRNALCQSVQPSVLPYHLSPRCNLVCINGLPSYLVQMLFSLRRCAVTLTLIDNSKVKVTQAI